jgi:hypothetical protein
MRLRGVTLIVILALGMLAAPLATRAQQPGKVISPPGITQPKRQLGVAPEDCTYVYVNPTTGQERAIQFDVPLTQKEIARAGRRAFGDEWKFSRQVGCGRAEEVREARASTDFSWFWIIVLGLAGIALALFVLYLALVFWPITIMILLLLIVLKLYGFL